MMMMMVVVVVANSLSHSHYKSRILSYRFKSTATSLLSSISSSSSSSSLSSQSSLSKLPSITSSSELETYLKSISAQKTPSPSAPSPFIKVPYNIIQSLLNVNINLWTSNSINQYITIIQHNKITSNTFINTIKNFINIMLNNGTIDYSCMSKIISLFGNLSDIEYVLYIYKQFNRINTTTTSGLTLMSNTYLSTLAKYIDEGRQQKGKAQDLENEILSLYDTLVKDGNADLFTHNIVLNYYSHYGDIINSKNIYSNVIDTYSNSSESKVIKGLEISQSLLVKALVNNGNNDDINDAIKLINDKPYASSLNTLMYSIGYSFTHDKSKTIITHNLQNVELCIRYILKINDIMNSCNSTINGPVIDSALSSLMSGLFNTNREDLVLKAYHLMYSFNQEKSVTNIPAVDQSLDRLYTRSINSNDIYGSNRVFNVLLASVNVLLENNKKSFDSKSDSPRANEKIVDPNLLWDFIRKLIFLRMRSSSKSKTLFDSFTIASAIDCSNAADDYEAALAVWRFTLGKVPFFMSQRCIHSYLRSFSLPSHLTELSNFADSLPFPRIKLDGRTIDEVMNAFLRCGSLLDGINYGRSLLLKKQTHLDIKYSAIRNVLIYFERYWRDYDCDMKRDIVIEINELTLLLLQWKKESNNGDIENALKYCWASLLSTSLVAGTYDTSFQIISSINELNSGAVTSTILGKI